MKNITCFVFACLVGASAQAQNKDDANQETLLQPFKNIEYKAETQVSASNHRTPLWLNANNTDFLLRVCQWLCACWG